MEEIILDEINRNKLDNRKANLRHVTHRENLLNRKFKNKSGYKGVYLDTTNKRRKPFKASIRRNGKSYHLGWYETAEEAARKVKYFIDNEKL